MLQPDPHAQVRSREYLNALEDDLDSKYLSHAYVDDAAAVRSGALRNAGAVGVGGQLGAHSKNA
jgi:hypothetical protein